MGGYGPPKTPKKCERCGGLFMRKSGNGIYCPPCRKVKLRLWMNESIARNREHYRAKNRREATKLRRKWKVSVMQHYSEGDPSCVCCGESKLEFLNIDHINNNGNDERKTIKLLGTAFYGWLIKHSYPSGYQVLCTNCNFSKVKHGVCIHELKRRLLSPLDEIE